MRQLRTAARAFVQVDVECWSIQELVAILDRNSKRTPHPLSAREVGLLAGWERGRTVQVTLEEIRCSLGVAAAPDVVKGLVRKGVLERVGRGSYLVHPLRTLSRDATFSSPVRVATLMAGRPYYLGGLWAFAQHQLTSQVYGSVLDVYVLRALKGRRLGNAAVRFHVVPANAMTFGLTEVLIETVPVRVSDPERTLLDALDHPAAVGGVRRSLDLVRQSLPRLEVPVLVRYAAKGARLATCQRLGVLLERAQVPSAVLGPLRGRTRTSSSVLSLVPGAPRNGRVHPRWLVVENR